MTPDARYRLALVNMAQGAQRQADTLRTVHALSGAEAEEQAQAYDRVAVFLANEADAMRAQEPARADTDMSPPHDRVR